MNRVRPESNPVASNDSDLNDCLSQYLQAEAALTKVPPPQPMSFMARLKQEQQQSSPTVKPQLQRVHVDSKPVSSEPEFRVPQVPPPPSTPALGETTGNETTLSGDGGGGEDGIFAGMKFEIVGFEADEFEDQKFMLIKNGAKVVTFDSNLSNLLPSSRRGTKRTSSSTSSSDYVLLPMVSPAPIANPNQVTVYWMVSLTPPLPTHLPVFSYPFLPLA